MGPAVAEDKVSRLHSPMLAESLKQKDFGIVKWAVADHQLSFRLGSMKLPEVNDD